MYCNLSFVIFRTSLSPHLRAAFLMLLRVYINLHYYCHEWWYSLFFLGGFVVKFILNLIFKLTWGTSLTACFLFFNQVLTIWGKSLASRWAWAIRTLLPSLVATPWFVAVYSCLLHSNVICMHALMLFSWAFLQGRCHKERSGFEGPWTRNPLVFDNSYFKWVYSLFRKKKQLEFFWGVEKLDLMKRCM